METRVGTAPKLREVQLLPKTRRAKLQKTYSFSGMKLYTAETRSAVELVAVIMRSSQ
jgi:hypothetical protein